MKQDETPNVIGTLVFVGLVAVIAFVSADDPSEKTATRAAKNAVPSEDDLPPGEALASTGHGRHATRPDRIPAPGWKDILWRTYEQFNDDRLLAVAAGVVFYGLLALFPAITALVSCYALVVDPQTINGHLAFLSGFLPEGSFSIVEDQVARVLSKGNVQLGSAFLISLLLALWSANGGVKAIIDALNVVYDEKEKRGFLTLNAISLTFTIGGVLGILIASGLVVVAPVVFQMIGFGGMTEAIVKYGRWPALAILLLLALAVLYRFAPSRRQPKWRWISVGSVVATVTWMAGSALLSFYLANFGHYDATYGSLGAAIALMIWMWMSTIVILVGAELNSEIEHQTTADSTTGVPKPLGARGAKMADTVGAGYPA
jgi:membrane protein